MKIRKTRQEKRSDYSYPINVQVGSDKWETKFITIRPGEDGVTEADIKTLHSFDDSEVYYNNKNMHPTKTDEEKAKIKEFETTFIDTFTKQHGYEPNPSYVKDAIKEAFPTNWNLSIDWEMDEDGGADKSRVALAASVEIEHNPAVDHLYEIMESMTDKQREVLRMVKLEDRTLTEVAAILGTSIPNVKKHLDKAIEHIKNNY